MSVATIGAGLITPQELPLDVGVFQRAQVQMAEIRQAAAQKTEAALPGRQAGEKEPQHILHSVTADLEKVSMAFDRKLQFVVDQHSNEIIVKVIDRETDKVIKELPPEELQRMHSKLRETIGFLFDQWA